MLIGDGQLSLGEGVHILVVLTASGRRLSIFCGVGDCYIPGLRKERYQDRPVKEGKGMAKVVFCC